MAGWEALELRKASRTFAKRFSSCCGKCVSRSRPMQVRTKNKHSIYEKKLKVKKLILTLINSTSDNDRAGGLTQSSQHFPKSVSKTIAGEIPSHCVLN